MAKEKKEDKTFQDRWEADYMFIILIDKPVCLLWKTKTQQNLGIKSFNVSWY